MNSSCLSCGRFFILTAGSKKYLPDSLSEGMAL